MTTATLVCSVCGYGIARSAPPGHCPMCGTSDGWRHSPWRPFGRPAGEPLYLPPPVAASVAEAVWPEPTSAA